jgi:hypothetical protein
MQIISFIFGFMVYIIIGMLHLYFTSDINKDREYSNMLQSMVAITFWPLSMIYNFKRFVMNKTKKLRKI